MSTKSRYFVFLMLIFSLMIIKDSHSQASSVLLGWLPNTESELDHYVIYRDKIPGTMVRLDEIPGKDSTYVDNSVFLGETYYYKLTAADDSGLESAPSNEVMVTVGAVTRVEDNFDNIVEKFELKQNYPNPFNPTTMIEYSVPKRSYLTVKIYNILGKEIRTLVNGYKEAGIFKVKWDGRDSSGRPVSSGVYFYQMIAGDFRQVKRSIFQK